MRGLAFSCDRNNTKIVLTLSVIINYSHLLIACLLLLFVPSSLISYLLSFLALPSSYFVFLTHSSTLDTYFPSPLSPSFLSYLLYIHSVVHYIRPDNTSSLLSFLLPYDMLFSSLFLLTPHYSSLLSLLLALVIYQSRSTTISLLQSSISLFLSLLLIY